MTNDAYVPFSQRTGLAPIPPQLKIGEISSELRRLLHYAIFMDMKADTVGGYSGSFFDDRWKALALDLWVRHVGRAADAFENEPSVTELNR